MNFGLYKPTELERSVITQYKKNGIYQSIDLDLHHIASIFSIDIQYYHGRPFAKWGVGHAVIFLSLDMEEDENRKFFFHELCHIIRHVGDQRTMPELFRALQEAQASHFQLYASIPFYMLRDPSEFQYKMDYIVYIMQDFKVGFDLAKIRFEQIERRIFQASLDRPDTTSVYYLGGWHRIL